MTNGIIKTENGFAVKDFETGRVTFNIGQLKFPSYTEAAGACRGKFYPSSFHSYLLKAEELEQTPDAEVWQNMVYADDPHGVWDGEKEEYRNVSTMNRGAATDEEVAYIDALDATYTSLLAMVQR